MTVNAIKELRDSTGLGVMECKRALDQAAGNMEDAKKIAMTSCAHRVKPGKETAEGCIASYIHDGRIGALVELRCETDFVSKSKEFKQLAQDIAQHVVGMAPANGDDLLNQPYVKNAKATVGAMIGEYQAKVGENIQVANFSRFETGCKFKVV